MEVEKSTASDEVTGPVRVAEAMASPASLMQSIPVSDSGIDAEKTRPTSKGRLLDPSNQPLTYGQNMKES